MTYQVESAAYSGPLDLLLNLIERSRVEITDISLAEITSQYVDYITKLGDQNPVELNWFIDLAAKLVYLKSQALMPTLENSSTDDEIAELNQQLSEFARYREAAEYLQSLIAQQLSSRERPVIHRLPPDRLPMPKLSLETLSHTFANTISQLPPEPVTLDSTKPMITLEQMQSRLRQRLQTSEDLTLQVLLTDMTSRAEAVIMFLALLELVKLNQVSATQADQFSEVRIVYVA
jgi:segregation and condensation protein A